MNAGTGEQEPLNPKDCSCEFVHCSEVTCRSAALSSGAVPELARAFPAALIGRAEQ